MYEMFAIKCNEGYLRIVSDKEVACVAITKASVFGAEGMERATKAMEVGKLMGLTDLRIVTLQVIEKDPSS